MAVETLPKRPRGRPRLTGPASGVPLTTWMRLDDYDRLAKLAAKHDVSISGLVRNLVLKRLPSAETDR